MHMNYKVAPPLVNLPVQEYQYTAKAECIG